MHDNITRIDLKSPKKKTSTVSPTEKAKKAIMVFRPTMTKNNADSRLSTKNGLKSIIEANKRFIAKMSKTNDN